MVHGPVPGSDAATPVPVIDVAGLTVADLEEHADTVLARALRRRLVELADPPRPRVHYHRALE